MKNKDKSPKKVWDMNLPELFAAGKGFWVIFPLLAIFQATLASLALIAIDYRIVLATFVFCTIVPAKILSCLFNYLFNKGATQ